MRALARTAAFLALASTPFLVLGAAPSDPAAATTLDTVTRTGVPREWRLDVDGTVYVRLGAEDPAWFEARPTASGEIRLEELLLFAILTSERADAALTATGKQERTLRGRSPEDALPLLTLERRR